MKREHLVSHDVRFHILKISVGSSRACMRWHGKNLQLEYMQFTRDTVGEFAPLELFNATVVLASAFLLLVDRRERGDTLTPAQLQPLAVLHNQSGTMEHNHSKKRQTALVSLFIQCTNVCLVLPKSVHQKMSCPSIRRIVSTTAARISPDTCTMLTIKS